MATSTAKPYVVTPETTVPKAETRSGWITFGGIVMLFGAVANFFWGLAALDTKSYLDETGLLYSSLETWGWVALGWSALLLIGGIMLLAGVRAGPVVGIVLASVSCVFWPFALPVMPLYAITVMVIDVFLIYGLSMHLAE